jgi:phage terminase large subunit-like protein
MRLTDLVVVPDEGAGQMVRSALAEAGIPVEVKRHHPDHPYVVDPRAEPWRILVPEARLGEAQQVLKRLEHEMADELEAQALAAGPSPDVPRPRRR